MASSGNFANNNIRIKPGGGSSYPIVPTNSNRTVSSASGSWGAPTTMGARTGKWYIEYYVNSGSSGRNVMVVPTNRLKYNDGDYGFPVTGDYGIILNSSGGIYNNSDTSATQTVGASLATGDIMGVAMNLDASPKTVQFYRNGTTTGTAENINTSATGHFAFMNMGHNASTMTINAGQDSSFCGEKGGSANAADDNGFGNFYYTPPSGFLAMCTANLPIAEGIDPAETNSDYPSKQFGNEVFVGNGGTQTIQLGDGFQPDLVITKNTGSTNSWILLDSSRGYNKTFKTDDSSAEGTNSYVGYGIESDFFGSTGIVANDGGSPGFNNSTANYLVHGWRANGGTTSTNTSGTITSSVQANQAAGFSIITYTGTGTNGTIGHGLSAAPDMIWFKRRSGTAQNWKVYHSATGATKIFTLNDDRAEETDTTMFQDTEPTSSVISIGTQSNVNTGTADHIAYAWHSVEGYSKFDFYEGNSNADGPYVYTGFRPRLLFVKLVDSAGDWWIQDTARDTTDSLTTYIAWNRGDANATGIDVDVMANGFKILSSSGDFNSNTVIYGAWADVPFKYNNARS